MSSDFKTLSLCRDFLPWQGVKAKGVRTGVTTGRMD